MATITRRSHRSLISLATAYADQPADEALVIPEDLTALTDEEVATLAARSNEAFDALYGDGSATLSDEDMTALADLTTGIEALAAEQARRDDAQTERREAAAALAARVHLSTDTAEPDPDAEPDEDEGDDEDAEPDEAEPEVGPGDPNAEPNPPVEPVEPSQTASARGTLSINLRSANARQPQQARQRRTAQPTMRDVAYATTDTLGFGDHAPIDWNDAGAMLDKRLQGFSVGQYEAAQARGQHIREQHSLMAFHREIPKELMVASTGPDAMKIAMDAAVDQSRLPGGALTAAGWCAPSEILYDLCSGASRDGILSLPEVGVGRGGVMVPVNPTFASLYSAIGFHFTEADAIANKWAAGSAPAARANTTAYTLGQTATIGTTPMQVTVAGTSAGAPPTVPPFPGGTVVDGTVTWIRLAANPNAAGAKPCYTVTCPTWQDYRLEGDGVCIQADLLAVRGYPEMLAWVTQNALIAHDHQVSAGKISKLVAGSTPITMTTGTVGTAAPLLAAIELQVEHYRYSQRLSRNTLLEAIFPFWIRGAIRQDLSVRLSAGSEEFNVTDAQVDAWFRSRGVVPQYVYDWQALDQTAAASFKTWPTTVSFLLYEAGTWVSGVDDIITLDSLYDSTLLGQNKFTALFTEEAWLVAKRCIDSRLITVPVMSDGSTHAGVLLTGDLIGS